ncbi:hypothetical protein H8B06_05835 [Sphingobacterium sp. DN00404]|uniref:Outer membrane protein beta-barrel domain-containing protein n=1 Tax=Sphingobacterium micropteri TaxID=2763501 RepID=A0ABR7YLZ7_9SPHI|nr:hypothetical protein [Sphingobacterium micropteri]MBD1432338.1 hypothetical protein [Sphingobacterium micropteri]
MKKFILFFVTLGFFGLAKAQEGGGLRIGAHGGLPVGNASDVWSFNFGADVSYLFEVAPRFHAGLTSGYTHYLGKDRQISSTLTVRISDLRLIPIAATGRFQITPDFFFAGDIGYGIFVGDIGLDDVGGSFYYQPKVGYSAPKFDLYAGYKAISVDGKVGSINLGISFKF